MSEIIELLAEFLASTTWRLFITTLIGAVIGFIIFNLVGAIIGAMVGVVIGGIWESYKHK